MQEKGNIEHMKFKGRRWAKKVKGSSVMGPKAKEDDLPKYHTIPPISEASLWILPHWQLYIRT